MSQWRLTITAPEDSAYSGAEFTVLVEEDTQHTPDSAAHTLIWESPIYHPYLAQGQALCECVTLRDRASREMRSEEEVAAVLVQLLRRPLHWQPCESCHTHAQALAEAHSDPTFFARKARVRTPGTHPLPDEDLMAIGRPAFDMQLLLTTGAFSDLKITVGKTVFRCHRTVLAASSAGFARLFATQPDGGSIRIDSGISPRSFGLFLKYIYLRQMPSVDMSLDVLIDLIILAATYEVSRLHQFCMAALYSCVRVETVCEVAVEVLRIPHHEQLLSQLCDMIAQHLPLLAHTHACKILMDIPAVMEQISAASQASKDSLDAYSSGVDSPQN